MFNKIIYTKKQDEKNNYKIAAAGPCGGKKKKWKYANGKKCSATSKRRGCNSDQLYISETANCGPCKDQPLCISPDPNECPSFKNVKKNVRFINNKFDGKSLNNHTVDRSINCIYDKPIKLYNSDDLKNYISNFDQYNKKIPNYYSPIMDFCLEEHSGNKCNINNFDGGKFPSKCPIILSNTDEGETCRTMFLSNFPDNAVKKMESKMQQYCQKRQNRKLPACYCLASSTPNANKFSDIISSVRNSNLPQTSDTKCWFNPCRPPLSNTLNEVLLPKNYLDTSSCPKITCGNFISLYNNPNLNHTTISQSVDCPPPKNNENDNSLLEKHDIASALEKEKPLDFSNDNFINDPQNVGKAKINFLNVKYFNMPLYVYILLFIFLIVIVFIIDRIYKKKINYKK